MSTSVSGALAFGALLGLLIPGEALAYVDPGAGSLAVQVVLGGAAGVLVVLRIFWSRLTGRRRRLRSSR